MSDHPRCTVTIVADEEAAPSHLMSLYSSEVLTVITSHATILRHTPVSLKKM